MSGYLLVSGEMTHLLHLWVIFGSPPAKRAWGCHFQWVSMSVNTFFSRTADRIFLKFNIKLEALNYQNLRNFSEKWGKATKFLKNKVFWLFTKIWSFDVSLFNPTNGTLQCCLWFSESFLSGKSLVTKWGKTNQITGFFDHQYFRKGLVDIKGGSIWD